MSAKVGKASRGHSNADNSSASRDLRYPDSTGFRARWGRIKPCISTARKEFIGLLLRLQQSAARGLSTFSILAA
jgi:hypothetical protein